MKITFAILFILLLSNEFIWGTQQIETVVFPSEDEIAEAFALGEISFDQFIILTELIANQIEPTSFLLDEIPNSLFKFDTLQVKKNFNNQTQYFLDKRNKKSSQILIKNQYASYLDEDAQSRYQTSLSYKDDRYIINITLKKEYSGRERFTRRYISYSPNGKNYSITAGNFYKRFALGGIIGYRGKLFSVSDNIDNESFLFPDYGGFNGIYFESINNKFSLQTISSFNRNEEFSVFSNVLMLKLNNKNLPSVIIGYHQLKNREIKTKFHDYEASLYKHVTYANGFVAAELIGELNNQNKSTAMLLDGRHKTKRLALTYSFWNYGESFLNISGGSKTSLISERDTIYNVQYNVLSKRSNQTGGILKTQIQIAPKWQINTATLFAYKNSDTTETQIFTQLSNKIFNASKLSIDLLYRNKVRMENSSSISQRKIQSRLMFVYNPDKFYVRNYILILNKTDEPFYVGLFSEIKYRSENYGLLHLWLNMSRMNSETKQLDYFYGFIKNEIRLYESLYLNFKLSHRYNRSVTDKVKNQFSINASWQI